MICPVIGRISADFDQMRPLSAERKTHVHGAIDIAAPTGTDIVAPEDGLLYYFKAVRPDNRKRWDEVMWGSERFPFQNYFYDMYGSLIVLVGNETGFWHVITHSYWNQLFNLGIIEKEFFEYQEQREDDRFPIFAYHNLRNPLPVNKGKRIGFVGNAGYSTGAHAHIEIHDGRWQKHEDRIRPEEVYAC